MKTMIVAIFAAAVGAVAGFMFGKPGGVSAKPAEVVVAENATPAKPAAKSSVRDDAERLAKAQKRIAELEKSLAAARRTIAAFNKTEKGKVSAVAGATNSEARVVSLSGEDADVLGALKSQLTEDEFSQVTNAMTQLRTRLAEKAKGRMDYLASIETASMSDAERENHERFLSLLEKREAAAAKMKGGIPDAATIQKMVELEMQMAPVAKKERSSLVRQVARELGYQGDDVNVIGETMDTIFDCTTSGGLGGLGDIMEGAEGMPAVKVETHVIAP